eukprot:g8052.t1
MADVVAQIPSVDIGEGAHFKYVLVQASTPELQFRTFVRGDSAAEWHADVAQPLLEELAAVGLQGDVLGGGFMSHMPAAKRVYVWGASQKYGPAHHAVSAALCRAHFARLPGYKVKLGEPPKRRARSSAGRRRAAAGHAPAAYPAAVPSDAPPPQRPVSLPIRVAMLGAGVFANSAHLPALLALPHLYDIRATYSRTQRSAAALARRARAAGGTAVAAYYDVADAGGDGEEEEAATAAENAPAAEQQPQGGGAGARRRRAAQGGGLNALLTRPDVEAVCVALPVALQPAVVLRCLDAGLHVLSEAPVAHTSGAARALLAAYRSRHEAQGVVWRVAENYRFEPAFGRAARLLAAGAVGAPVGARVDACCAMREGG